MAHEVTPGKFSQASISRAAEDLLANPDEYFRRCRERQALAAKLDVAERLDVAMRARQQDRGSIWSWLRQLLNHSRHPSR